VKDPRRREPKSLEGVGAQVPRFKRAARYSTWFKAVGSVGPIIAGADSPKLLEQTAEGAAVPQGFYSNQSSIMGQVRWGGIVPLKTLVEDLNKQLQEYGEEIEGFDFRHFYQTWEYRYYIVERFAGEDTIVVEDMDARFMGRVA